MGQSIDQSFGPSGGITPLVCFLALGGKAFHCSAVVLLVVPPQHFGSPWPKTAQSLKNAAHPQVPKMAGPSLKENPGLGTLRSRPPVNSILPAVIAMKSSIGSRGWRPVMHGRPSAVLLRTPLAAGCQIGGAEPNPPSFPAFATSTARLAATALGAACGTVEPAKIGQGRAPQIPSRQEGKAELTTKYGISKGCRKLCKPKSHEPTMVQRIAKWELLKIRNPFSESL